MKSTKILVFNSVFIVPLLYKLYIWFMKLSLLLSKSAENQLVIIRNDYGKEFINDKRNISGNSIRRSIYELNLDAHEFYEAQADHGSCDSITYAGVALYELYARQCKTKFVEVIAAAHRLADFCILIGHPAVVISDKQSIEVLREGLKFIGFDNNQVRFKVNWSATSVVLVNSWLLRCAACLKTRLSRQELPTHYYRSSNPIKGPALLVTSPAANVDEFYNSYLKKIHGINIVMYGLGEFVTMPVTFVKVKVPIKKHVFLGQLTRSTSDMSGYIADILLINAKHSRLYRAIAITNFIFMNEKIDFLLSRQQVHVVDNYFVMLAKKIKIPIIADVFEQVFYCDAAVVDAPYSLNPLLIKVLADKPFVFRGVNEFMRFRLHGFDKSKLRYLSDLLGICGKKIIIFYASDPGKNQCQRFQLETFLMREFSKYHNVVLVVKTHHQDDGAVTLLSYKSSGKPENTFLIGDNVMKKKINQQYFHVFNNFDFNAAVYSCDGFLTTYSTSALQAVKLNVKTGIIDFVDHKYMRDLVDYRGAHLINDAKSLQDFIAAEDQDISAEAIEFYGLSDKSPKPFDMGFELKKLLARIA